MMLGILLAVLCVCISTVFLVIHNFNYVKAIKEGTPAMREVAQYIREGASEFLREEWKLVIKIVAIVTVLFGVFLQPSSGISFLLGVTMSGLCGYFGMKMATYANVRTAYTALKTRNLTQTVKVALRGGSIMGLLVPSLGLGGLVVTMLIFSYQVEDLTVATNWIGLQINPFSMTISCYGLGCSIVALFNRVGGGIFTKAADVGADMVGKVFMHLKEDDRRNPASLADNVGDNVGDIAGLGSDLLESFVAAPVSVMAMIPFLKETQHFSDALFTKLLMYPIMFCGCGMIACMIGLMYVLTHRTDEEPHKTLNRATSMSAGITAVLSLIFTLIMFAGEDLLNHGFRFGSFSPFIACVIGIAAGLAIGKIAEFYTSADFKPTKEIANAAKEGAGLVIIRGLSLGMKSTLPTCAILGGGILLAYFSSGLVGISLGAVGMLSFVGMTVAVDSYGPIVDNAGGIAEMCELPAEVREKITEPCDEEGNTTAAKGKGFAIGSAQFAMVALLISFIISFTPVTEELIINFIDPLVLVGALVGGALTFYFSGYLGDAVGKTAQKMVDEIVRQFRTIKGLAEGKVRADHKRCIRIATKGALHEMKAPGLMAIITPLVGGFIMGPEFLEGSICGTILAAVYLAILTGNAGGAWDNAKKDVEGQGKKGTPEHDASVIGDTVGDPLKDTEGPSLDILGKIYCTMALTFGAIIAQYNLLDLLAKWLG